MYEFKYIDMKSEKVLCLRLISMTRVCFYITYKTIL